MKNFKFFDKEDFTTDYNGEISNEAVTFFNEYINNNMMLNNQMTRLALYSCNQFERIGTMLRGQVVAQPIDNPRIKIIYYIIGGNQYPYITGHSILAD